MQETLSKSTTGKIKPTAAGFVDYLGFVFPKATLHAKIAFAVKVFVTQPTPPFDAQSLLDCLRAHHLNIVDQREAMSGLRGVKTLPEPGERHVRNTLTTITRLRAQEIADALTAVGEMERQIQDDPTIVPLAVLRQVFAPLGSQWSALITGLRDIWGVSDGRTEAKNTTPDDPTSVLKHELAKGSLSIDASTIASGTENAPLKDYTKITFGETGTPKIETCMNATSKTPLASPAAQLTFDDIRPATGNEYTHESVKRTSDCALAIRNMLLVQEGRARLGLSAVHDKMASLGYDKATVLGAIDGMVRTGALYMDGHALVPSTMLPSTLAGWGPTIIDLNREKGWYDEEQLSEKAARALAKLSPDEREELLQHMPLIPHREPKGRIDVATFCTNLTGEISELWEAYRKNELDKPCDKAPKMRALGLPELTCAEEEIADILIRTLDTAEFWGLDISRAMKAKHLYNASRSFRHGNKRA